MMMMMMTRFFWRFPVQSFFMWFSCWDLVSPGSPYRSSSRTRTVLGFFCFVFSCGFIFYCHLFLSLSRKISCRKPACTVFSARTSWWATEGRVCSSSQSVFILGSENHKAKSEWNGLCWSSVMLLNLSRSCDWVMLTHGWMVGSIFSTCPGAGNPRFYILLLSVQCPADQQKMNRVCVCVFVLWSAACAWERRVVLKPCMLISAPFTQSQLSILDSHQKSTPVLYLYKISFFALFYFLSSCESEGEERRKYVCVCVWSAGSSQAHSSRWPSSC